MALRDLSINPLRLVSMSLLLLAPFEGWMTLSAFGFVIESNLWNIANSQTNFPLSPITASIALYSAIMLIAGAIVSFKVPKIGLLIASSALAVFGFYSYSNYGVFGNGILVSILPGLGFFVTLTGITLGLASVHGPEIPIGQIVRRLWAPRGLAAAGIFTGTISLAADGWNHWSTGHLQEFMGVTGLEMFLHRMLFVSIAALLLLFLVRASILFEVAGTGLVLMLSASLAVDAVYHVSSGYVTGFVGQSLIELVMHTMTYYGMASLLIARFLLRREEFSLR